MVKTAGLPSEEENAALPATTSSGKPNTGSAGMEVGGARPSHHAKIDANVAPSVDTPSFPGARMRPALKSKAKPPSAKKNAGIAVGAFHVPGVQGDSNIMVNDFRHNHTTPTLVIAEARLQVRSKEDAERHQTHMFEDIVDNSKWCGVQKKVWIIALTIILVIVGSVVGTRRTFKRADSTTSSTLVQANLLQKLEHSIIRTETDRILFENATSPQSLALEWLSTDPFSLAKNCTTVEILERYVLVVLYYSTNGLNWKLQGLSLWQRSSVCDWNNGFNPSNDEARGIYCGGESTVQHVDLDNVGLTGTIPWELGLLGNLVELIISNNVIQGAIPLDFSKLSNLESLELMRNTLTGSLRMELPSSLKVLDLSGNSFSGTIPSQWGDNLLNITHISLSGNQLVGPIPSKLGQLTGLQEFSINSNAFTGLLHSELGQLTALTRLEMFGNKFTGSLPSELGLLTNLLLFSTQSNELTGTIPTELAQLQRLVIFTFDKNRLTGSDDSSLCTFTKEWIVLEGDCLENEDGSLEITCSCCTKCCNSASTICV